MTKRVAIYARISEDRNGEGLGVDRQMKECEEKCKREGWTVADRFVDNDISAFTGKVRPEFERLLRDVESGSINIVVCWASDRLWRRPKELERLLELIERERKLSVIALQGGESDLSTPDGRAYARIGVAMSNNESEKKAARQRLSNKQRAESGTVRWIRRPFGFTKDGDGNVVIVESEAEEIRRAVNKILAGSTLMAIVKDLNSREILTSTGNTWSVTPLKRTVLNPRIAGLAIYQGKTIGKGNWPAIIDEDDFESIKLILNDPKRRTQLTTKHAYLLSGILLCGKCNDGYTRLFASPVYSGTTKRMIYKCMEKAHLGRSLNEIDSEVELTILARLTRDDAVKLFVHRPMDINELIQSEVKLKKKLDNLASLLAEEVLTVDGVRTESARINEELEDVKRKRLAAIQHNKIAELVLADNIYKEWDGYELATKRAIINELATITVLPSPHRGAKFDGQRDLHWDWKTDN